jgi:Tfp pilus assembly protein PilO
MIQAQIPSPPEIPSPPFDPNLIFLNDGGPPAIVMIVFMALLATTVILWPVMRALARRLDAKGAADPALHAEIEQLHQRLGEVDALHQRVAELEERIDFTERMLARAPAPAALQGDADR